MHRDRWERNIGLPTRLVTSEASDAGTEQDRENRQNLVDTFSVLRKFWDLPDEVVIGSNSKGEKLVAILGETIGEHQSISSRIILEVRITLEVDSEAYTTSQELDQFTDLELVRFRYLGELREFFESLDCTEPTPELELPVCPSSLPSQ